MHEHYYLLVDVNYICSRARFSMGDLRSEKDEPVGTVVGFLQALDIIVRQSRPDYILLAFDSAERDRCKVYPEYKGDREKLADMPPAERELQISFYDQMWRLQKEILPEMGFRNVMMQPGLEGDDLIAYAVEHLIRETDIGTIYTADKDLQQCIRANVIWKNPNGDIVTESTFERQWGIKPPLWAMVKSAVGKKDNLPGISGVGPVNAAKWLSGKINKNTKAYEAIVKNQMLIHTNMVLSKLPFHTIKPFSLEKEGEFSNIQTTIERLIGRSRTSKGRKGPLFQI